MHFKILTNKRNTSSWNDIKNREFQWAAVAGLLFDGIFDKDLWNYGLSHRVIWETFMGYGFMVINSSSLQVSTE